jgi:NAD(P)-dependent dehydrogenase (short-subunit alcohol dehydrogenase family)
MFNLQGKVALVTGASSGIGWASALSLSQQGASVVVCARRRDRLENLASEINQKGGKALAVSMDVTNKSSIDNAVAETVKKFGRLDILLNNAGVAEFKAFLEMTEADWDKTLDTNLKGYFLVAQAATREMIKNKYGRIINISSIAMGGVGVGFANIVHYCASKGGVIGFTEALADELAPMGILVNAIAPGLIESEMTTDIIKHPEQLNPMLSGVPLKRVGKAAEIGAAVVYLASDEAGYTTGSTMVVDGGWLAA